MYFVCQYVASLIYHCAAAHFPWLRTRCSAVSSSLVIGNGFFFVVGLNTEIRNRNLNIWTIPGGIRALVPVAIDAQGPILFVYVLICTSCWQSQMTDGEPACCDDSIGEIVSSLLHVCERQEVMLRWRQPLRNWDSPFLFSYLSSQTLPRLPPPASPWLVSLLTCFISAAESRSESPVRFNHSPARGASSCCGKAGRTWREVKRISTRTFFLGGWGEGWVECLWLHGPDVMRLAGWQAARGGEGRRGGRRGGGGLRSGGPVLIWRPIPGGLKENLEKLVEELDLFVTWQKMASIWMSTFFPFSLMSDEFTSLEPLFCSLRFELSRRARVSLHVVCSCMFHGFVVLTHLKYSFFNRIRSFFLFFFLFFQPSPSGLIKSTIAHSEAAHTFQQSKPVSTAWSFAMFCEINSES